MNCLIAGASGLVGNELIKGLIEDSKISSIHAVVRQPLGVNHAKLKTILTNFDNVDEVALPQAKAAFCCLGTTIKKAGSQAAFFKIDHDYVVSFAKACLKAGVTTFIVVSALGAEANSKIFYNRVKGQTEEDLKKIGFQNLVIVRPSLILGERPERRPLEKIAQNVSALLRPLMIGPFAKARPVEAKKIAMKMKSVALGAISVQKVRIVLNHEI